MKPRKPGDDNTNLDKFIKQIVELPSPSIDETISQWKVMAAQVSAQGKSISRASPVANEWFEQFRPKRSARWLKGAPDAVIACYDNAGRTAARYTIIFGGSLWDTNYARAHWEAGLDPRLTPCLSLSDNFDHAYGIVLWDHCLPGRHLGRKIRWVDLPEHIRQYVVPFTNR